MIICEFKGINHSLLAWEIWQTIDMLDLKEKADCVGKDLSGG